jgi:hypothetical protein
MQMRAGPYTPTMIVAVPDYRARVLPSWRQLYPTAPSHRLWPKLLVLLVVVPILAFAIASVRPALLDPLCDGWAGDGIAQNVRGAAQTIHDLL